MAKVDGADFQPSLAGLGFLRPSSRKDGPRKGAKAGKGIFRGLLSEAEESAEGGLGSLDQGDPGQPMEKLLDAVTEAGEDLKREPTVDRIKSYKAAVRRFMTRVVSEGFDTEERSGGVNFKKRKKYTLVRVVDEKLESLAAEILHHQRDQLEILRRLDEIRGLLVDLMR
jgi:uncharacterized protein YaaR (DUF327 family)